MFDGIIVGNSSPGSGTIPTLQQVCDTGNTTTTEIICHQIEMPDEDQGDYVRLRFIGQNMEVRNGNSKGFNIDFSESADGDFLVKNNNGAILTDVSVTYQRLTVNSTLGDTEIVIPHGYGSAPTSVIAQAATANARTILGAGYIISWDSDNVNIAPTNVIQSVVYTFNLTFYFVPS